MTADCRDQMVAVTAPAEVDLLMKTRESNGLGCYYLSVKVNGTLVDALVDNGASVSVISSNILNKLNKPAPLITSERTTLKGFGSALVDVLGQVEVTIEAKELRTPNFKLLVVPSSASGHSLILGLDFLENHYMIIDTVNRQLIYSPPNTDHVAVPLKTRPGLDIQIVAKIMEETVISPNHRQLFKAKLCNNSVPNDLEGYLEPFAVRASDGLDIEVASSLGMVRNGYIFVELMNMNPVEVIVKPKTKVGIFVICDSDISVCENSVASDNSAVNEDSVENKFSNSVRASDLFDFSKSELSAEETEKVKEMLNKHRNAISLHDRDLGRTATTKHVIDVQGNPPFKQKYRRVQGPLRHEVEQELRRLEGQGVIEKSSSPWSSPLIAVRKKCGNLRICVDFRSLNDLTKKDSFPLPNLIDALSNLQAVKYFSTFDLMQGFHQIEMDEASKEYTAFSTGDSHWQWVRMPFGLSNSPASFMRLISMVLAGVPWSVAISYIDDVIVTGKTFEDHLSNCSRVLRKFEQHGLKIKPAKCSLFMREVTYLGHQVSSEGVRPSYRNVEAILQYPQPKTLRQVRRFIGMVNFFRRHIPNASALMKPLNELLKKRSIQWTEACSDSFEKLKTILTSPCILSYPDFSEGAPPLILTVDSSSTGAGAMLSQRKDDKENTLAFASTSFNNMEANYSATEKELAGIRWAVRHFRPLIYGKYYVIRTDHRALIYLNNMKFVDSRLMRTYEELNCGHYEIEYLAGKENVVADALSRIYEVPENCEKDEHYKVSLEGYSVFFVPGGPDSLFQALSIGLCGTLDEHPVIREVTVNKVLKNPAEFGFANIKSDRKKISAMKNLGVLPDWCLVEAFVWEFQTDVYVHEDGVGVVKFTSNSDNPAIHLHSLGGIHFNLLQSSVSGTDVRPAQVCSGGTRDSYSS